MRWRRYTQAKFLPYSFLGVLAYVPLFLTQHGRLNADTKLYLGEDPGGLISRSLFAWDSSQFGGFVPHQAIAYLWPSGPFYWLCDVLGFPQWVTQRLWVGTLFFLGATGVYVFLRWLNFSASAATIAAFVFQFSPYVLAYQSRTSAMLLPWAAVGWLCYFTARGVRNRSWLWPALIALTMFTVGAVNATATLLIIPAAVLVALHQLPTHRAISSLGVFSFRTILLTLGTSLWWITMLTIQGRYGADVLAYSETLESVSSTAHSFEVLRGFGYWLNYVGLDSLPLTTGAQKIITSPTALVATTLLPLLAVSSLAILRNPHRRLGLWLILVGLILAIGVYPLNNPSPLFESLANNPTSSLSLAFRSSTRAIPILLMGIAVGIAMMIDSIHVARSRIGGNTKTFNIAAVVVIFALTLLSHPTKFTSGAFDPSLERSPIPPTWTSLKEIFTDSAGNGLQILQLPGQEFGAYTWGYTIDPALPAVIDSGVLTRDLIPLGNDSKMNLLWAVDEATREGRLHRDALERLGHILSVNAVLFPGDIDAERYGSPTQEQVLLANALTNVVSPTSSTPNAHQYLVLSTPASSTVRQRSSTLLLLGDGKGIVDASIAGVLDGSSILYAGQLTNKQLATRATEFASVVVTDTHTERAQHWRTSIDTNGMDEDRDGGLVNFGRDPGDIRMRIFPRNRPDDKTWFEQVGPVRARASSYGPPLSYRPEHRPFAAIDNNPSTAWTVAHGVQPLAPVLSLVTDTPINSIRLLQPTDNPNRVISDISLSLDGGTWEGVSMTEESLTTGQEIALSSPASSIALRIDTVRTIREPTINEELAGVGFAEVATGLSPTTEIGVLPTRGLDTVSSTTPLSYVMSRRVAPLFRDSRTDIETLWSREFSVPNERSFTVSARIDTSLFNREQVVDLLNEISSQPLVSLDGQALSLIPTYNEAQQAIVAETNPLVLTAGSHQIDTTWASESLPAAIDQVTLRSMPTTASQAQVMFPDFTDGLVKKSATLEPCPDGCWLVLGEGYSAGWSATMDEQSLGEPQAVDGGANGWWLAPFDEQKRVTLEFTPQKTLNIALILTALSVVLSLAILFVAMWRLQRKQISDDSLQETFTNVFSTRISFVVTTSVTAVVFLSLFTLTIAVATTLLLVLSRFIVPVKNLERAICALFVVTMTSSVWEIISTDPPLNFAWASATSGSHHTILYAVTALAVLSLVPESRQKIRSRSQRSGQ